MKATVFSQENIVSIPAVNETLEALFARGGGVAAVICSPHPHFAGTMHNKVISTLTHICIDQGFSTLRFNYRGVGASTGSLPTYAAAVQDAVFVKDWLHEKGFDRFIWLGFSYGGYVASFASGITNTIALFTVAPSVAKMPYDDLPPITCPWHMIQGMQDEVIDIASNLELAENSGCRLHKIDNASHFFHGQLSVLRETLQPIFLDLE